MFCGAEGICCCWTLTADGACTLLVDMIVVFDSGEFGLWGRAIDHRSLDQDGRPIDEFPK